MWHIIFVLTRRQAKKKSAIHLRQEIEHSLGSWSNELVILLALLCMQYAPLFGILVKLPEYLADIFLTVNRSHARHCYFVLLFSHSVLVPFIPGSFARLCTFRQFPMRWKQMSNNKVARNMQTPYEIVATHTRWTINVVN